MTMLLVLTLSLLFTIRPSKSDCIIDNDIRDMYLFNFTAAPQGVILGRNYSTTAVGSSSDLANIFVTLDAIRGGDLIDVRGEGLRFASCPTTQPSISPTTMEPTISPTIAPTMSSTESDAASVEPTAEPTLAPADEGERRSLVSSSDYAYFSLDASTLKNSYSCCNLREAAQSEVQQLLRVASTELSVRGGYNATLYREQNFSGDPFAKGVPIASCKAPFSECVLSSSSAGAAFSVFSIVILDERTGHPASDSACFDLAVSQFLSSSRTCYSIGEPSAAPTTAIDSNGSGTGGKGENAGGEIVMFVTSVGCVAIVIGVFAAILRRACRSSKRGEDERLLEEGFQMSPRESEKKESTSAKRMLSEARYAPVPPTNV